MDDEIKIKHENLAAKEVNEENKDINKINSYIRKTDLNNR
jgi:hypothetical protein